MARWTETWLSGPSAATWPKPHTRPQWPGENLGLPFEGVGSVSGGAQRFLALVVDLVLAGLITSLFIRPEVGNTEVMQSYNYTAVLVWVLMTVPPAAMFGFTPGMAAIGVRVARLDGAATVGLWRSIVRCVLTFLLIPVAIRNVDGRGLHDRATGTVVVHMR